MFNYTKLIHDMKTFKKHFLPLFVYFLSVLALFIYLYGFFPIKFSLPKKPIRSRAINPSSRVINKLVFIIIDALRYDFIAPNIEKNYMPFTMSSILENQSCIIKTKANSPTVTMPRIKAITSGSISSYVDVALNFMSSDFKEDNFINIAKSNGFKVIFYGDNTWLKLFPKAFTRSEGTNSFFALDYIEVDNNVTRHIDKEFKKSDWDIIILHYLGLDHIGHTEGPKSPLIKTKLKEMDDIIKKISVHLKILEEKKHLKTMFIVTGDHGMKDSGSHGGMTYPEVTVPLVSIGKPCVILPGWPKEHPHLQIDIAPTISVLLGLPIPSNSIGKIIPALLHGMQRNEILDSLEQNRLELEKFKSLANLGLEIDILKRTLQDWQTDKDTHNKIFKDIVEKYFHYLHQINQDILQSNYDFSLPYLIIGVVFMWSFLINLCYKFMLLFKPYFIIHWFFIFGTILHAVSLTSSSFIEEEHQTWYFLWTTFFILIFLKYLNLNLSHFQKIKFLLLWIIISLMHRTLRKLNQTGDKWAFLPDIKSYLYSGEGQSPLFIIFLLGVLMVFCCALTEKCSFHQLITYGISLFAVVCYRIVTGNFNVKYLEFYSLSRGIVEVSIFWAFMSLFFIQTIYYKTPIHLVWLLLGSLLFRPHNIILLPIQIFISKQIHKAFCKSEELIWNNIAHIWLGNVFYFYQGNGNSLANIDIASGFVGVQTYNPIYSGLMMAAHTSSGHILSFILSPKLNAVFAITRIIPLAIYCTALIFQLNHLFIWSVFSPKLLYEINTTVTFLMLMVINNFIHFVNTFSE